MNFVLSTGRFFSLRPYRMYVLLFVVAFLLLGFLQLDPTFADPDSFYHAKMAVILSDQGMMNQFPWLSATDLKNSYTNHHLLYHAFLVPFVELFPPLIGVKVASVLLGSLTFLVLLWLLRHLKVSGAFWYVLFLLTVNPFIFRLGLVKAQPLVILFLFFIIYLLFNRRYFWLTLMTVIYTWLYAGWPLLILMVGLYSALNIIFSLKKRPWLIFKKSKIRVIKKNLTPIFCVITGVFLGVFFSPYFPGNVKFFYQQSFKIAIVNYQNIIGVGAEWYPYGLPDLVWAAIPFFVIFVLALVAFIVTSKKQSVSSWFFLVMSALFFVLTLKSRRYVEYFIPFGLCFSAISLNAYWDVFGKDIKKSIGDKVFYLLPIILIILVAPFAVRDLSSIKNHYFNGLSFNKFELASNWLKENSGQGDIVLHGDWDEFPILFYHNSHNYYIVGLDPTFMYDYDADLYDRWVRVVEGKDKETMYQVIKSVFGAKYVFVDYKENKSFDNNLSNNVNFEKVFEGSEAKIYLVK